MAGTKMDRDIEEIKNDLKQRFIVCPMPNHWHEIYKILLENNKQNIEIAMPLILAEAGASDRAKYEKFTYHLSVAQELGILSKILNYLDSLDDSSFEYSDELRSGKPLSTTGYWHYSLEEADKVNEVLLSATDVLEEIQRLNKEITDDDILLDLFLKNGFDWENKPKVKKGKSLLVDLLVKLYDLFESQKCFQEGGGTLDLDSFCFYTFDQLDRLKR